MPARCLAVLAIVAATLVAGSAPTAAQAQDGGQVAISFVKPEAFQIISEVDVLLARLARDGKQDAARLQGSLASQLVKLKEVNRTADGYQSRNLTEADLPGISAHNAHAETVWGETVGLLADANLLFLTSGRQSQAVMAAIAKDLVDSKEFHPDAKAKSKCNLFLNAFAQSAFGYDGFEGKKANAIVDHMRSAQDGWQPIHDPKNGSAPPSVTPTTATSSSWATKTTSRARRDTSRWSFPASPKAAAGA